LYLVAILASVVFGCGGSGGSSPSAVPTGNKAVRAASLASYQSLGAGMGFPNRVLRLTAPKSSKIGPAPLFPELAAVIGPNTRTLTYDPDLGLYETSTSTSNSLTVDFYSDSAGTAPAGNIQIKSASSLSSTSYPLTINASVNITAGNIPMTGSCIIKYLDGTGNNTMSGQLALPKNHESVTIGLTLSPSFQVGGTVTVVENSTTLTATNIQGTLDTSLSCDFTMNPGDYTGQGTLNFATGVQKLTFNSATGTAAASITSDGSMVVDYSDGTTETIVNPISALLVVTTGTETTGGTTSTTAGTTAGTTSGKTSGTSSGTSGGTTSGNQVLYNTPTLLSAVKSIVGVSLNGDHMVTQASGAGGTLYSYYYSTPTGAGVELQPKSGAEAAAGVNASGQMVGTMNGVYNAGCYWSSAGAQPVALTVPSGFEYAAATSINDGGEIIGIAYSSAGSNQPVYWKTYKSMPVLLNEGSYAAALGSPSATVLIDNKSQVLDATGENGSYVWTSSTANPIKIQGARPATFSISDYGVVGDSDAGVASPVIWTGSNFTATALKTVTGSIDYSPETINDSGVVAGGFGNGESSSAGVWFLDATPIHIASSIPSSPPFTDSLATVFFIFNDGSMVVSGGKGYYYVTPKS
jgi:hypothetical protein